MKNERKSLKESRKKVNENLDTYQMADFVRENLELAYTKDELLVSDVFMLLFGVDEMSYAIERLDEAEPENITQIYDRVKEALGEAKPDAAPAEDDKLGESKKRKVNEDHLVEMEDQYGYIEDFIEEGATAADLFKMALEFFDDEDIDNYCDDYIVRSLRSSLGNVLDNISGDADAVKEVYDFVEQLQGKHTGLDNGAKPNEEVEEGTIPNDSDSEETKIKKLTEQEDEKLEDDQQSVFDEMIEHLNK